MDATYILLEGWEALANLFGVEVTLQKARTESGFAYGGAGVLDPDHQAETISPVMIHSMSLQEADEIGLSHGGRVYELLARDVSREYAIGDFVQEEDETLWMIHGVEKLHQGGLLRLQCGRV